MKRNIAHLPLHTGKAPKWLFNKMRSLAELLIEAIVLEFGPETFLERLSDPYWFQSFGCVLGFDWHSSGLTTTTTAAIKEALLRLGPDINIFAAGGKGATSRKTPEQLLHIGEKHGFNVEPLIYTSRLVAKVDSAAYQDGYSIYTHTLFFIPNKMWAVVQQGMNEQNRMARRYHWYSEKLASFTVEPHTGIVSQRRENLILNLTAAKSVPTQEVITHLATEKPDKTFSSLTKLRELKLPKHHDILLRDINPNRIKKILEKTYEKPIPNFEALLMVPGLGAKTVRALALMADIIYGTPPSYEEPAIYSFAHGGKDGIPYPVDKKTYSRSLEILKIAVDRAKMGDKDKLHAMKKLTAIGTESS